MRFGMKRLALACLCAGLFFALAAPGASANAAEPPRLTVIVERPPADLTLSLRFGEAGTGETVELPRKQTAWEAQYRFTYGMVSATRPSLERVTLIAASGGNSFEYLLPEALLSRYNNIVTLDFGRRTVTDGQTVARTAALVSLRVALTLLVEGAVFFLMGYRQKRSWLVFLLVNLITQGALNYALNQSFAGSYLLLALIFYEVLVALAELVAFALLIREHRRRRAAGYVLLANLASFVLGGFLITYLPI